MKRALRIIDKLNENVGLAVRWVALGMILSTSYEVVARYFFNAPTVWAHQTVMILGGVFVTLSWGWVLLHHAHVAMDILSKRLSPRKQAIAYVVGSLLFLFPLLSLLIYTSSQWLVDSYVMRERWTVSIWRPLIWPSRLTVVLGFVLLLIQGTAEFIRALYFAVRGETV